MSDRARLGRNQRLILTHLRESQRVSTTVELAGVLNRHDTVIYAAAKRLADMGLVTCWVAWDGGRKRCYVAPPDVAPPDVAGGTRYRLRGAPITTQALGELVGLSHQAISLRLAAGETPEDLVRRGRLRNQSVAADTISAVARRTGLSRSRIRARLSHGEQPDAIRRHRGPPPRRRGGARWHAVGQFEEGRARRLALLLVEVSRGGGERGPLTSRELAERTGQTDQRTRLDLMLLAHPLIAKQPPLHAAGIQQPRAGAQHRTECHHGDGASTNVAGGRGATPVRNMNDNEAHAALVRAARALRQLLADDMGADPKDFDPCLDGYCAEEGPKQYARHEAAWHEAREAAANLPADLTEEGATP